MTKTLHLEMSQFYKSTTLKRNVFIDEIQHLTGTQRIVLKDELALALYGMQKHVKKERQSSLVIDEDWMHKITNKITICQRFLRVLNDEQFAHESENIYTETYYGHLDSLLIEKIGKSLYEIIKTEAHNRTIEDLVQLNKVK